MKSQHTRGKFARIVTCSLIGLLLSICTFSRGADDRLRITGPGVNVYNPLAMTDGNDEAIHQQTLQERNLINSGASPTALEEVISQPVHPVEIVGNVSQLSGLAATDLIPLSPGASPGASGVIQAPAPTDIVTSNNSNLSSHFAGYADLGPNTLGETELTTNPLTHAETVVYYLDKQFEMSDSGVLTETTPTLTMHIQGSSDAERLQAASYLTSIRQALLASVPPLLPLAAALAALGAAAVAALKKKRLAINNYQGYQATYEVTEAPFKEQTDVATVTAHEEQHVADDLSIMAGSSPIQEDDLSPDSPFYAVAHALMEVRAGIAEILSNGEVNGPYLAANTTELAIALASLQSQLAMQNPALLAMAQQDLAYAEAWLQSNNESLINF